MMISDDSKMMAMIIMLEWNITNENVRPKRRILLPLIYIIKLISQSLFVLHITSKATLIKAVIID